MAPDKKKKLPCYKFLNFITGSTQLCCTMYRVVLHCSICFCAPCQRNNCANMMYLELSDFLSPDHTLLTILRLELLPAPPAEG